MKKIDLLKFILCFFLVFSICSKNVIAIENKILIKVNNEIITTIDIFNETKYLKALNPEIKNLDNERLLEISKNSLIREKVKLINLLKIVDRIYIDEKLLNSIVRSMYKKININSLQEYKLFLKNNDLSYEYITNKITIDRLWNEMIFQKFSSKIKIDREIIKNEILNNPDEKLLLSEILVAKAREDEIKSKFKQIENDIKNVGFNNSASIHSISDTATQGGRIGWIDKNSLNKILRNRLSDLSIGQYTKPILTPSGYLIIKIENKKTNQTSKEDLDKKIERLIIIKTNQQLNQFSNIYLNKLKNDLIINEI